MVLSRTQQEFWLFRSFPCLLTRLLSVLSSDFVTNWRSSYPISSITPVALQQLTGKGRSFLWLPEHQVEFDKLKNILSSDLIVRHFNHRRQIYLLTDASRLFGIGYALGHMDRDQSGKEVFKIVNCGSKGLRPTQQRYSTIELECMAIVWAILKCSFYLSCLLYTSPSPRDRQKSRMPSSA